MCSSDLQQGVHCSLQKLLTETTVQLGNRVSWRERDRERDRERETETEIERERASEQGRQRSKQSKLQE